MDSYHGLHRPKELVFAPHDFKTRVQALDRGGALETPRVVILSTALDRMHHYVDIAEKEVGWLGTARRDGNDFIIEEVFLLKQKVHATTTAITTEGLAEFVTDLMSTRPDADKVINNLRFWGHSHVYMGTFASSQDEYQVECFRRAGNPWFIRGILNKLGRIEFTIFDFENGLKILDPVWAVAYKPGAELRAEIEAEFERKVEATGFWESFHAGGYRPYLSPGTGLRSWEAGVREGRGREVDPFAEIDAQALENQEVIPEAEAVEADGRQDTPVKPVEPLVQRSTPEPSGNADGDKYTSAQPPKLPAAPLFPDTFRTEAHPRKKENPPKKERKWWHLW